MVETSFNNNGKIVLVSSIALIGIALLLFGCTQSGTATSTPPVVLQKVTLTDLATHNTPADCWIANDGNVYNISKLTENNVNSPFKNICGTVDANIPLNRVGPRLHPQGDLNGQQFDRNSRNDFNRSGDMNGLPAGQNFPRPSISQIFSHYLIGTLVQ